MGSWMCCLCQQPLKFHAQHGEMLLQQSCWERKGDLSALGLVRPMFRVEKRILTQGWATQAPIQQVFLSGIRDSGAS